MSRCIGTITINMLNKKQTKIAEKNPLFSSPNDKFGNVKFTLNAHSAKDFQSLAARVEYSINFQRYYLFNNPPGSSGHSWQRNLFLNMINYQPIDLIEWVYTVDNKGKVSIICESLDGQQRTKTFLDIVDNKVKLPKKSFIHYDGKEHDVSNMSYKDLYTFHKEYVDIWLDTYAFLVVESRLQRPEKHKRFVDKNDHNILSDQDRRSSLDNPLSNWLNKIMFSQIPDYKFLIADLDKACFKHMPKLSIFGKVIQEIVSKVLVFGYAGKYTNIGKSAIDALYDRFGEEGDLNHKDIDRIRSIFDDMMSTVEYIIIGSSSQHFWKKRDIMILMILLWNLISSKKQFDKKLLKGDYVKVINSLKKKNDFLNKWAFDKGYLVDMNNQHKDNRLSESIRERNNTFASCYTSGDSPITLEFVVESIKTKLIEQRIVLSKDSKRVFSKEQKQQALSLQDNKCAGCGDELNPDNTLSYEGDHIIEHSQGGKTTIDNCEILCLSCHQHKTKNSKWFAKIRNKYDKLN